LLGRQVDGHVAIRPESIHVLSAGSHELGTFEGVVRRHQLLGGVIRYQVESRGVSLWVDRLNRNAADLLPVGASVRLQIQEDDMRVVR